VRYVTTRRGCWLRERRGITRARVLEGLEQHEFYVVATVDGVSAFRVYLGDIETAEGGP